MTPDQTLAAVAIIGVIGTVANLWLTLSIRNSILGLKLWTREHFVTKEDLQQSLQLAESRARIMRGADAH